MKKVQESGRKSEAGDENAVNNVWDCGSVLYDSYELVTFSHIVERHFMVLPYLSGSRIVEDRQSPEKPASEEKGGSSIKARKPSVLCFLSQLIAERNVWKRKRKIDGERAEKSKKQKTAVSKIFPCSMINSSWK